MMAVVPIAKCRLPIANWSLTESFRQSQQRPPGESPIATRQQSNRYLQLAFGNRQLPL